VSAPRSRFWEIFFEVYEALPRQGPGFDCAARAFRLCGELPPSPAVLDLGCGVGGQTLHLAKLTSGSIVAVDNHAPSIERLRATLGEHGLSQRVSSMVGDMADPGLPPQSFDLIWSEGALYSIGIEKALRVCHALLRPGGRLAFSDAVLRSGVKGDRDLSPHLAELVVALDQRREVAKAVHFHESPLRQPAQRAVLRSSEIANGVAP
jgi:SAM-dependent methyltransferase